LRVIIFENAFSKNERLQPGEIEFRSSSQT
jgi:hypothetical protein